MRVKFESTYKKNYIEVTPSFSIGKKPFILTMIADKIKKQCRFCNFRNSKKNNACETCGADVIDWYIEEDAIKQILQALIEREEKLKIRQINEAIGDYAIRLTKYHPVVRISDIAQTGFDVSKQDTIDYLKSEIEKI